MKTTLALLLLLATCTSLSHLQSEGHFQGGIVTKLNPWQKLTLTIDVVARDSPGGTYYYPTKIMLLQIHWNGVMISDWRTSDYNIHTLNFTLQPIKGLNTLQFRVPTKVQSAAILDNIKLTRKYSPQNLLINGGFEDTSFSTGWKAFDPTNTIPGWRTLDGFAAGPPSFFSTKLSTNHANIDNNTPSMYQAINLDFQSYDNL